MKKSGAQTFKTNNIFSIKFEYDHRDLNHYGKILSQIAFLQDFLNHKKFKINAFLKELIKQTYSLVPADNVSINLLNSKELLFRNANFLKYNVVELDEIIEYIRSNEAVSAQGPLFLNDILNDFKIENNDCLNVRSLIVMPIFKRGEFIGEFAVSSKKANSFCELDVMALRLLASLISYCISLLALSEENNHLRIVRNKEADQVLQLENKLVHLATYDPLTHLLNPKFFMHRLEEVLSKNARINKLVALIYLDIDFFKAINDELGHDFGDELLKAFATRLKHSLRSHDIVGRMDSDDFMVIIEDLNNTDQGIRVASKLLDIVKKPFHVQTHSIKITVSIGITFCNGETAVPDALIKQSEYALHLAKKSGRNTFRVYLKSGY